MSKEVIACDVDEVLFPFIENFLRHYNEENGTNFEPEEFEEYHFHNRLGLSVPKTVDRINEYTRESDHSTIELLDGAEDAIERLASVYELEIITARHPEFEVKTWTWLQEQLPEKFRAIKAIGYAGRQERAVTKAEVCTEIGAIALIDDSIDHIRECHSVGIPGVLFGDYSWNRNAELPEGAIRCADWPAVARHFGV